ncbi:MAG TPA: TraR/DksA family transcriptional regulator [Motilibacterales bacterium]|nr:TraR/DksA family transcriptional regulator [Motilibacterales bacterium]
MDPDTVPAAGAEPEATEAPAATRAKAPAGKAPAGKAPASKAPASRARSKKPAPRESEATKAPARKPAAAKAPPKESAATTTPPKAPAATTPLKAPVAKAPAATKAPTAVPVAVTPAAALPGPAWTEEELAGFRLALEADIHRLREELHMGEADMADLLADAGDSAGDDQADAGSKTLEREQEMSVNANARDLLDQSTHALRRLEAGTYGVCESCGAVIPAARLRAFPRATLCIACKQAEERR